MVAIGAKVLQLSMAVRAQHEIRLNRISARSAFAVFHQLPLLERNFQLLLVASLTDSSGGRSMQ